MKYSVFVHTVTSLHAPLMLILIFELSLFSSDQIGNQTNDMTRLKQKREK